MFITEEEKRLAVNLAMRIDVGQITLQEVVYAFDLFPLSAKVIMAFWCEFNDMTKNVAERVGYEKCRKHLEVCYRKEVTECKNKNLRLIHNGLKQIYYGVKECLTGVGLILKKNGNNRQH